MQSNTLTGQYGDLTSEQRLGARSLAGTLGQSSLLLILGFLAITTFEGVFRYVTAKAGMPWLVYLKDVLVFMALLGGVLRAVLTDLRNPPFFLVLTYIIGGMLVGGVFLPDIRQSLFAAKTWLPLLCGTVVAGGISLDSKVLRVSCLALWIATIAGILLTLRWHAPWVGFGYEVGGIEVEGAREWSIGGVDRVPGFSRSSFDAALQCVFLGGLTAAAFRRYTIGLIIWLASLAAIYATTSRSALAAAAVGLVIHLLVQRRLFVRFAKLAIVALTVTVVALPFAAGRYYQKKMNETSADGVASASSFQERSTKTWPDAFKLVERRGNWVVGRGLGGVGVGQKVFEASNLYNPGDNFFVYVLVAFGAAGGFLLLFLPYQACRASNDLDPTGRGALILVACFLAVGLTLNGIESAVSSFCLGLALYWLRQRRGLPSFAG